MVGHSRQTFFAPLLHPALSRRTALQAGSVGLLGLGIDHLAAFRDADASPVRPAVRARSVIYIFLSGGLAQHDSFDLKPLAPENIRGEFLPIDTKTPGIQICEHLPLLAQRSDKWALVRSLGHYTGNHSLGHMIMLSGRSEAPPAFSDNRPQPTDWPSIASIAGDATRPRNNLPPAVVLPERFVHYSGRVIPGQFGGQMGNRRDPWFIEASPYDPAGYGAYPTYGFDHQQRPHDPTKKRFQAPNLTLPDGFADNRLGRRLDLLGHIDEQRRQFDRSASTEAFERYR